MPRPSALLALLVLLGAPLQAQDFTNAFEGRRAPDAPQVRYTLRASAADPSGYDVEMVVRGTQDTLRIAFPTWAPGAYRVANFARNIHDLSVRAGGRVVESVREDSSTWRAVLPARGEAVVRYRMRFPGAAAARTPNNRSFLTATGGLIDGPQAWAYIPGHTTAPAHVRFEIPAGWRIATGLAPTGDPAVFFAPTYDALVDSPVLIGRFRSWRFLERGVPHHVAFWLRPDAPAFDTTAFVRSVRTSVATTAAVMGDLPYREYTFIYVDGPGGGLEHLNSTTIGVSANRLKADPLAATGVTLHEYFHLWNVKRVRPVALGPFDYQQVTRSRELWWSEGITDYFEAALSRRAGFLDDSTARAELVSTLASYVSNPAVGRLSPERTSETAWDHPVVNEGLTLSYYLQGRLIGELLELRIREATNFARGLEDVMRVLYARHAGERGFTGDELRDVTASVCGCELSTFWERFIREGAPLNFDDGFGLMGMQMLVRRVGAMTPDGRAAADLRISVMTQAGYGTAGGHPGGRLRLSVGDRSGAWGRGGVMTGDELVSIDGRAITTPEQFRGVIEALRIGDSVRVDVLRQGAPHTANVRIVGYDRLLIQLLDFAELTERQRAMRRVWMTGRP